MDTFAPFGWMHLIVTGVSAIGWLLIVCAARRSASVGRESTFRWMFGLIILVAGLGSMLQIATREGSVLKYSLPLQACDIAWILAAWSILSGGDRRRLRHQLLYYWGFGFSAFAYWTPSLESGPGRLVFWQYWTGHWFILAAAIVNLVVFRVRPSWRDYLLTVAVTAATAAAMTVFNIAFDTNYFFTGDFKPNNPTVLDLLGPWPLRIVWIVLIAVAIFTLMTLPAGFRRRNEA